MSVESEEFGKLHTEGSTWSQKKQRVSKRYKGGTLLGEGGVPICVMTSVKLVLQECKVCRKGHNIDDSARSIKNCLQWQERNLTG